MGQPFSEALREKRLEMGLLQRDLGKLLGVTNAAVSKWERGTNAPCEGLMQEIGKLFGIRGLCRMFGPKSAQKRNGHPIREARLAKRWTQAELARRLGIEKSSIYNWEKGVAHPSADKVELLRELLNLDIIPTPLDLPRQQKTNNPLKSIRLQQGLTQKALAKKIKCSPTLIHLWEKGQNVPQHHFIKLIAALSHPLTGLVVGSRLTRPAVSVSAHVVTKRRCEMGWSARTVAEKVGCSRNHISRVENFLTNPKPELVEKLAQVLRLTKEQVWSGEE